MDPARTADDPLTLVAGALFHERYRVVRCIKAGGMGAVYEVRDEATNSPRALKVMLPSVVQDADMRARFAQEAKVTGEIESEHITHVLDAGVDEPTRSPFLVMEMLRGQDLGGMVQKRGPLPPAEVVLYLHHSALALEKTHAAGIVHRDLKPENIFVVPRDDGSPCAKLLDFGIAKMVKGGDTHRTRSLGTPLYMAPEQVRGDPSIGPRTDVYSMGHVAYALLAGEPYWQAEQEENGAVFHLLSRIVAGAQESPSARAARRRRIALPPTFDTWFATATAVDQEHRFGSARAAVDALAHALDVPLPRASIPGSEPPPRPSAPPPALHVQLTPPGAAGATGAGFQTAATTAATSYQVQGAQAGPSVAPPRGRAVPAALVAAGVVLAAGVTAAVLFVRGPSGPEATPVVDPARTPVAASSVAASAAPTLTAAVVASLAPSAVPADTASAAPADTASAVPASPGSVASGAPVVTPSAAPADTASAVAAPADVTACAVPLFPPGTFVEGAKPDFAFLCTETDPRRGGTTMKSRVILGNPRGFTEAKTEWALQSWYEMASFAVVRARCCAAPPPLRLPPLPAECSMEPRINDLAAAVLGPAATRAEKAHEATDLFTKSIYCVQRNKAYAGVFPWKEKPVGGEATAFKKTLARVLGAP